MHAYLRKDGHYDLYDTEPKVITAEEYANLQKLKELEKRKEQLLAIRNSADSDLAKITEEIAALKNRNSVGSTESSAAPQTTATKESSFVDAPMRRKW